MQLVELRDVSLVSEAHAMSCTALSKAEKKFPFNLQQAHTPTDIFPKVQRCVCPSLSVSETRTVCVWRAAAAGSAKKRVLPRLERGASRKLCLGLQAPEGAFPKRESYH
jgi:hypothetical protein